MSEITKAIEARQAQIVQLQGDIDTLQRAASIDTFECIHSRYTWLMGRK